MKLKNLLLGAVAAAFLTSCGSSVDMKDPKAVTEAFHNAFADQDWDGAKALATANSAESIDAVAGMAGMAELGGESSEDPKKLEKVECDEPADDKCNCTATLEGGGDSPYSLVKEGEDWKVEFSKGGDMGDAMGDVMEGAIDEAIEEVAAEIEEVVEEAAH